MTTTGQLRLQHVIGDLICDIFEQAKLRFQPGRALKVAFSVGDRKTLWLAIWAPMNYVGVLVRENHGPWKRKAYHDSGWRYDGVERFFAENADRIEGLDTVETRCQAYAIVELGEKEHREFEEAIKERYTS
jgi:hypothetical protein